MRAQLGLFDGEELSFDPHLRGLRRITLAEGAWLDVLPGWLRGHALLFDHLFRTTTFHVETRQMYEREVEVPRCHARLPADGPGHPILAALRAALEARYREDLVRVSVALYRDGRDSVAFHGDYVARRLPEALVASVSLGGPRRFLIRPTGGGRSVSLSLGSGDLLVMGGTCQRTHQHAVPKCARAEPRMAVMFRPIWIEPSSSAAGAGA